MAERSLPPEKSQQKQVKVYARTRLGWPRIKKIISVDNGVIEGELAREGDQFYLRGRICQQVVYLDWKRVVRVFELVIPFQDEPETGIGWENNRLEFFPVKHLYKLEQSKYIWGSSFLEQELVLDVNFSGEQDVLGVVSLLGLQKKLAMLVFPIGQKESRQLKQDKIALLVPAKEITTINLKTGLINRKTAGKLVSCLLKIVIELYYLGTDDREHYEEATREVAVQIVLDYSAVQVELTPLIELVDYRLSQSGYGLALNYLVTVSALSSGREKRNVLVQEGLVNKGLDYSLILAFLDLVAGENKKEIVFDSSFILPGWVVGVTKSEGKSEIITSNHKGELIIFKGLASFDLYCLDSKNRQYLIQRTKEFSLTMQLDEDNNQEQKLESDCRLSILNHLFDPQSGSISLSSLIVLNIVLIQPRLCYLVTDISGWNLSIKKESFLVGEVVSSDSCRLSFSGQTRLFEPARRVLESRASILRLLKEVREDSVMISGLIEQELNYVSLNNLIHVQRDTIPFAQLFSLSFQGYEVRLNAGEVTVLTCLGDDGSKVLLDYLFAVDILLIEQKTYELPIGIGVKNHYLVSLDDFEETVYLSIPMSIEGGQCRKLNTYIKEIGISRGGNRFYIGGKLALLVCDSATGKQWEEELGFYHPLTGEWGGFPLFYAAVTTANLCLDQMGKNILTLTLKLYRSSGL